MLTTVTPERVVDFRTRTVLRVLLIVLCVAVTLEVVWIARHVLAWVVIALFLALALNPLVSWIQRRVAPPFNQPCEIAIGEQSRQPAIRVNQHDGAGASAAMPGPCEHAAHRVRRWRDAQLAALTDGWRAHPVFGAGLGAVARVIRSDSQPWAYELSYNALLFQTGLVGLALYVGGVACALLEWCSHPPKRCRPRPTLASNLGRVHMLPARECD